LKNKPRGLLESMGVKKMLEENCYKKHAGIIDYLLTGKAGYGPIN
jgi:hypothetical protein